MNKKKVAFFCELSAGHLNVALSIAKRFLELYSDKTEIFFLVNETYKKKLEKKHLGIKFIVYDHPNDQDYGYGDDVEEQSTVNFFSKFGEKWAERDRVKFVKNGGHQYKGSYEEFRKLYPIITEKIKQLKPDFVLIDTLMTTPVGIDQGIPYAVILSAAPTFFGHHQLPPPRSGLPGEYTEENIKIWKDFIEKAYTDEDYLNFMKESNNWLKERNCVNFDDKYTYYSASPYLNIYNYPKELDYQNDKVKMPGNWVRLDSAVTEKNIIPMAIPDKLKNLPGKLIYFSLGSMASSYQPLMKRLIDILSKIPHRFIISTGLIGEKYEMKSNQYGEKFLNQLSVLQIADIFISHGGNNSVTESFHFGVPMIVLPLFADQIDNGQRISELNYGKQLDPFTCTKEDLEDAINFCSSESLKKKFNQISIRCKQDNGISYACSKINELLGK